MAADPQSPLRDIFLEAAELTDATARDEFLCRACANDVALRARVEALLAADAASRCDPPEDSEAPARRPFHPLPPPPRGHIGHYRIVERIGEGGCGAVFLAEQEVPVKRKVAIKVIKPGMDTKQVVVRFEAERQALAMMDHPNIAKVFDAGTTESGQPFIVMEWVRGIRITEFCTVNGLDLRQRVELFLEVCQAVHHAHQRGIIHRDLKPSNILVSPPEGSRAAVPKVIDFGIAKAVAGRLTDQTLHTFLDQMVGTPDYMSPEQAAGGGTDIDTRTDVYSLGVLFYELITGQTPFAARELLSRGFDEMRRTIREEEPERPSTRVVRLRRSNSNPEGVTGETRPVQGTGPVGAIPEDLDWLVMKCLEKDRARRYETVNGLAQDLRRWLGHEAVSARPPSASYRLQKWIRRNRIAFTAVTAVSFAVLAGLGVSTVMFLREKRARGEMEAQRAVADRQRREFQEQAYASDMRIAQHLVDGHDLEHAGEVLERHRPTSPGMEDLRGFEWRYLWQACQGSPHDFLPGDAGMPWALVTSPDGEYVAAASDEGTSAGVTVWRLATREVVARLEFDPQADGDAAGAVFSDNGQWLVTACHRRVKFFELGTWRELTDLTLTNASGPIDLRGNTLVTTAVGHMEDPTRLDGLVVWDLRTRISTPIPGVAGPPTLSPDGQRLVVRTEAGLEIRRVDQPEVRQFALERSSGVLVHGSGYGSLKREVAFSPDGRRIAAPGLANDRGDLPVVLWDASDGRRIDEGRLIGHAARIHGLAWAPDSSRIATASADGTIRVWDLERRSDPILLAGHLKEPWSVTFDRRGQRLISSSIATSEDQVKIWLLDGPESVLETGQEWYPLWLSRDGSEVFSVSRDADGIVRERLSGRTIHRMTEPPGMPALDSASTRVCVIGTSERQGALLGFSDGQLASWFFGSNRFPRLLRAHHGAVRAIVPMTDQGMIATGGDDHVIRWWRLDDGALIRSNLLEHPVTALSLSSDGKLLMSASGESAGGEHVDEGFLLSEWDVVTGRLVSTQDIPGGTSDLGCSPDGRWLAVCATDPQGRALTHLLDLRSRTWHARLERIGRRLDFSPDGAHLLIWSMLWDLRPDPPRAKKLSGHRQMLMQQTFSPDGRTAVSTGDDGTVRLWSVATGQEMLSFVERGRSFDSPVFSADGTTLAVGSFVQDGRPLRFWHAPPLADIDRRIREGRVNR